MVRVPSETRVDGFTVGFCDAAPGFVCSAAIALANCSGSFGKPIPVIQSCISR